MNLLCRLFGHDKEVNEADSYRREGESIIPIRKIILFCRRCNYRAECSIDLSLSDMKNGVIGSNIGGSEGMCAHCLKRKACEYESVRYLKDTPGVWVSCPISDFEFDTNTWPAWMVKK